MIHINKDSDLSFNEYLESMLSKDTIEAIEFCRELNVPVIITGGECTGKSTLERVLRNHGYDNVYEDVAVLKINLKTKIPGELTADAHRYIR